MATETSATRWATVQVQVPDSIADIAEILDDLIGALIAVLEVTRAVLGVVKALLVGLLDPLAALVDAAIEEIEGLLNDVRQIGVYVSGDLDVEFPFDGLLGGFQAYERRMIARLVDRTDPTRPTFTSRSAVVAVFLYASFDTTAIHQALAFIAQVKAFFGIRGKPRAHTVPVGLTVSYGASNTALGAFGFASEVLKQGAEPSVAGVQWQMAPPPNAGSVSWPLPAPAGFLVEVSTVKDGLILSYRTPAARARMEDGKQSQVSGLVLDPDGQSFRLYGGFDVIEVGDLSWSRSGTTFTPLLGDGKTLLYAYKSAADDVPVPPNGLLLDGKHILQRTFFVDAQTFLGVSLVAPGQPFATTLRHEDMPYNATFEDAGGGAVRVVVEDEPAREVYVRVSAVTKEVSDVGVFLWRLEQSMVEAGVGTASGVRLAVANGISAAAKTDASAPLKLTFPSTSTARYLDAVATALVVMVLSRSDLVPTQDAGSSNGLAGLNPQDVANLLADAVSVSIPFQPQTAGQETGLEDIARFLVQQVVGANPSKFCEKPYDTPATFRGKLLRRCRAVANELLAQTGPLPTAVEGLVLAQATATTASGVEKPLYEVTWHDLDSSFLDATLLDSLDPTKTDLGDGGVAPNPSAISFNRTFVESRIGSAITLTRAPGFVVQPEVSDGTAPMGTGSADYSPVLYTFNGSTLATVNMRFCRNVFLENPSVLTASRLVLNVASATLARRRAPGEGAWLAFRLFPQGLPPVDAAMDEIVGFLHSIKAGIQGVTDAIVSYIEFLEARILELEALLRRIQGLLDLVVSVQVPAASGLVVTANGTDGILQALVAAENKPQDSARTISRVVVTTVPDGTSDGLQVASTMQSGSYGVGVVLLAGGLPAAVQELFQLLFTEE